MRVHLNLSLVLFIFFILAGFLFILRFFLGGDEDTWICSEGKWVKHGNPLRSAPAEICE